MGEEGTQPDAGKKPGLGQKKIIYAVIGIAVIILVAIVVAKVGFGADLLNTAGGEMAIAKRPAAAVQTPVQGAVVRPSISIRPEALATCAAPTTLCGESCVDVKTDQNNCGVCGRVCSVTYADAKNVAVYGCSNGQCTIVSCQPGYGDCTDKGPLTTNAGACETDLRTGESWINNPYASHVYQQNDPASRVYLENPANCGTCGNKCTGSSSYFGICDNGVCRNVCWGTWLNCDNSWSNGCEQVFNDNNCGACGAKCPADTICNNGCCVKKTDHSATVPDSLGVTCSGNPWNRQAK